MSTTQSDSVKHIQPENYPIEVKKCIDEMRQQRERIYNDLGRLEQEKKKLQNDIKFLTNRLSKVAQDQASKTQFKIELDKTIEETEQAYKRILETSRGVCKTAMKAKKNMRTSKTVTSSQVRMPTEEPRRVSVTLPARQSSIATTSANSTLEQPKT